MLFTRKHILPSFGLLLVICLIYIPMIINPPVAPTVGQQEKQVNQRINDSNAFEDEQKNKASDQNIPRVSDQAAKNLYVYAPIMK